MWHVRLYQGSIQAHALLRRFKYSVRSTDFGTRYLQKWFELKEGEGPSKREEYLRGKLHMSDAAGCRQGMGCLKCKTEIHLKLGC